MSSIASSSNSSPTDLSPRFKALPTEASYSLEEPIAFSKIDGLEVTPLRLSLSISFFRCPSTIKPRARKSSQTAWPWLSSALTGFMGLTAVGGLRLCEEAQQSIPKHNASHNITIPKTTDLVAFFAYFLDARARLDVMSALHDRLGFLHIGHMPHIRHRQPRRSAGAIASGPSDDAGCA